MDLEEINDPQVIAHGQAQDERARRNSDWLQAALARVAAPGAGTVPCRGGSGGIHRPDVQRSLGWPGRPTPTMTASSCNMSDRNRGRGFMEIAGEWLPCSPVVGLSPFPLLHSYDRSYD